MAFTKRYRNIPPIQPPCRKTIYDSREEAEEVINHIKSSRVTPEIKSYKCDICGFWHLTSRSGK